jgi:hypothetical protein
MVAAQSVDEINIAITVFGSEAVRWDGLPDEKTPKGWASMPSQEGLDAAKEWLSTVYVNNSTTAVDTAIRTVDTRIVLRVGGDINDETVIIISDLLFDNYPGALLGSIVVMQHEREKNGARPASVGFVGIGAASARLADLRKISKRENFWLAYVGDPPAEEEEEEDEILDPPSPLPDPIPSPLPDPSPN